MVHLIILQTTRSNYFTNNTCVTYHTQRPHEIPKQIKERPLLISEDMIAIKNVGTIVWIIKEHSVIAGLYKMSQYMNSGQIECNIVMARLFNQLSFDGVRSMNSIQCYRNRY